MDEDLYDEEVLDLVVLTEDGDQTVPVAGDTPIALDEPSEPAGELLDTLLDSTVRMATTDGVPSEILAVLRDIRVPAAFRSSPWLAEHRPLTIRDGVAYVGGFRLHYSEQDGLVLPEPDEQDG